MKNKLSFLSLALVSAWLILNLACGKNANSLAKYEGYMVESVDNSTKDSMALPQTIGFDIDGTKFSTGDCWVKVKPISANGGEVIGGQDCSFRYAAAAYKVKLQSGSYETNMSPDGKHKLITVKFDGTTADGAKFQHVFKGQKSGI